LGTALVRCLIEAAGFAAFVWGMNAVANLIYHTGG
jgi:hypothetical protein